MKSNLSQLLGFAIALLLVINFITPSLASEQNTSLTLKASHASIDYGEKIRFTGKLVDGLGYAISGVPISIWDDDGPSFDSVGSTITDARGEFELYVTAIYWDGYGNPVEILAYFPGTSFYHPSRSETRTINIDEPPTSETWPSEPERAPASTMQTIYPEIILDVRDGSEDRTIRVFPQLLDSATGRGMSSNDISIRIDGMYAKTVSANSWSNDIKIGSGYHTIKATFEPYEAGFNVYKGATTEVEYYVQEIVNYDQLQLQNTPSKIVTKSQEQTSYQKQLEIQEYKTKAFDAKSIYESKINKLRSGIDIAIGSLTGLVYENPDASKKINESWTVKYQAQQSLSKSEEKLRLGKSYLDKQNYPLAYDIFKSIDKDAESIEKDLKWISKAIDDAKKLAKPTCFLFWCW